MRVRHGHDEEGRLEMTPMIDVTFLLLVFFLCTLQFKTLDGKLAAHLPKEHGNRLEDAVRDEPIHVRLSVRPGTDRVIEYAVGPLKTTDFETAARRLRALHEADPARRAVLDPRPGTRHDEVVRVLDRAIAIGLTEISFTGAPPTGARR